MIWIRGNERLLGEGFIVCLEEWEWIGNVCGGMGVDRECVWRNGSG